LLAKRVWLDKEIIMLGVLLHILKVILIILVIFFVLTFIVYIRNLDMKLTAALEPMFVKHYDKVERDRRL